MGAQRARHRKTVLRRTKKERNSNEEIVFKDEKDAGIDNAQSLVATSNLPLIEKIEDKVSRMERGDDNPYTNMIMKSGSFTLADAQSAMKILKKYSQQKGIDDTQLNEFEKLIIG